MYNRKPFLPSELIVDPNNRIYHLGLSPDQLADKVILVGDQNRVALIAEQLSNIDVREAHREFYSVRGKYNGKSILVVSTGIGTDNVDIVLNELDALTNIDFQMKRTKTIKRSLEFVRIGTCGLLDATVPVGTYALSTAAIGLDNLAHFYAQTPSSFEETAAQEFVETKSVPKHIVPYCSEANTELTDRFSGSGVVKGITITAPGFYGPQGRSLNTQLASPRFIDELENGQIADQPILNFEMESSALFFLAKTLNHSATTICLGIANRPSGHFLEQYQTEMKDLITYVLKRI